MTEPSPSSSSAALSLWLDLSKPLPDPHAAVAGGTLEDEELHAEGLLGRPRGPIVESEVSPPEEVPLDLLEQQARERLRAWVTGDAPALSPRVGRFTLLRRLGAGGMGTVYAAYDEELDRKVALKFLHPAKADDPTAKHRLLREAQALARLSHPNLVPVFEVGRHEGQVYLAMELVTGQTMRAWVDQHAPPWRAVLEAWIELGRALAVVHAEGLVHRDVKPDNAIMGQDGRARLVDFGLAREVGDPISGYDFDSSVAGRTSVSGSGSRLRESVTRTHAVLGTPAYLAPEQRIGDPCGPAADQYGFCVSLYEGLYGCRPPGPVREGLVRVPEGRRVPAGLRRVLSRGLAEEPGARFPTMQALIAALERPLRRRRLGWLTAGGLAAVGVAAAVVWGRPAAVEAPVPCAGVGDEIAAVWSEPARGEIGQRGDAAAERVLEAFAGEWAAVRRQVCEATRVAGVQSEAVLDRRMACLDRQRERFAAVVELGGEGAALAELPAPSDCQLPGVGEGGGEAVPEGVRAEVEAVHARLARARQLALGGRLDAGRVEAERARSEAEALGHEPTLAAALMTVGVIETLDHRGAKARAALERAVDLAEAHGDVELKEEALGYLVRLAIDVEYDAVAARRTWHHDAATLRRLGASRHRTAGLLATLGLLQHLEGDLQGAELSLRAAAELYAREGVRGRPAWASTLRNLANVLEVQGRASEANRLFGQARVVETVATDDSQRDWGPSTRGEIELSEGQALLSEGRSDEARVHLERALATHERSYGPFSVGAGNAHAALAQLAIGEGRLTDARRHADAADLAFRRATGPDDPLRISPLSARGAVAFELGDAAEAVAAFSEAVRLAEAGLDINSVDLAQQRSNLAEALLLAGQWSRARILAEQALSVMEGRLPSEHEDLAFPLRALGEAWVREGEPTKAIPLLERALALRGAGSAYPVERARTRAWLARALRDVGNTAAARVEARMALSELGALGDAYAAESTEMEQLLSNSPAAH